MENLQTALQSILGGSSPPPDMPDEGATPLGAGVVDPSTLRFIRLLEDHELPANARQMSSDQPVTLPPPAPPQTGARRGGPVPSTNRTWGDAEAEAAGLYEPSTPATAFAQALGPQDGGAPAGIPMPRARPAGDASGELPEQATVARPPMQRQQQPIPPQAQPAAGPPDLMTALRSLLGGGGSAMASNGPPMQGGPGGAPPQQGGGFGAALGNALRDISVGAASGPTDAPPARAVVQGYAGSSQATEARTAAARAQANQDRDRDIRSAALDRGQHDYLPGTGPDESGNQVAGMWHVNKRTGERTFEPGATITSRNAATARSPAALQIADEIMRANREDRARDPSIPEISRTEAIERAQRAPRDQQDTGMRERLASAAARSEQQAHTLNPTTARTPFDMAGALNRWRQYYGVSGEGGAPAGGRGRGGARSGANTGPVDADGSLAAARQAIARNPAARAAIIQRLEQNGITVPDDL